MAPPKAEEVLNSLGTLLLDDTGGLKGGSQGQKAEEENFEFIVRLLQEENKLVIKSIYCKILAATEPVYLEKILSDGGWDAINVWLSAALKSFDDDNHHHFLLELLKLLAMLPMNVNRLKENDTPKMLNLWLKGKKKNAGAEVAEVVDVANKVVKKWKDIVTKNSASLTANGGGNSAKVSKSSSNAKEKKRKSVDNGSVEGGGQKKKTKSSTTSSSTSSCSSYGPPKPPKLNPILTSTTYNSRLVQERKTRLKAVGKVAAAAAAKSGGNVDSQATKPSKSVTTSSINLSKSIDPAEESKKDQDKEKDDADKPKVVTTKVKASKFRMDFTSSSKTTAPAKKKTTTSGASDAVGKGKDETKKTALGFTNGKSSMAADSPMSFMEALDAPLDSSSAVTSLKAKLGRRSVGIGGGNKDSEILVRGSVSGGGLPASVVAAALSTATNTLPLHHHHNSNNNKVSQSDSQPTQSQPQQSHLLLPLNTTQELMALESGGGGSGGDSGGGEIGGNSAALSTAASASSSYLSSSNLGGYAPVDSALSSAVSTTTATAEPEATITSPVKTAGFSFYKDILEEQPTTNDSAAGSSSVARDVEQQPEEMAEDEQQDDDDLHIQLKDTSEEAMEVDNTTANITPNSSEEQLSTAVRTSLQNTDGSTRSILKLGTAAVKKKVTWTDERKVRQLVEERYFELDENERVNVNRLNHAQHEAMKRSDAQNEKAMMDEQKHRPEVFAPWRLVPIDIDVPRQAAAVEHGCKSVERAIQEERQKTTLEVRFYGRIPDTPAEPELEFHGPREPTKVIPTEDEATLAAQAAGGDNEQMRMMDAYGGLVDTTQPQPMMQQQQQFPLGGGDYYGGNAMINGGQQQPPMHFVGNNNQGRFPGDQQFGGPPPPQHQDSFNGSGPMANGHFQQGGPNHHQFNQGPPPNNNNFDNGYNNNNNNFGPGGQNVAAYSTANGSGGNGPMYNDYNQSPPNQMYNNGPPGPQGPGNHQVPSGGYFNQPPQDGFNNNNNGNSQWQNDGPPPGGPFQSFGPQQGGPRFFGNRGGGRGGRFNKKGKNDGICRFWANTGKCKFDDRCNFSHHLPGISGGR